MTDNATKKKGPLAGLRIIDSTTMVAMPMALHIMADMGAEVIKVETHTLFRTEAARLLYADNEPGDEPWNRDGSFNTLQRSKLGVTLNLKVAEGVQAFKELTRISDVVVENNRSGTMDRLGLSYEELKKEKPDLIYVSNTGFGHTGPWRTYAGIGRMFELTCGLSQFTGYPDEGPRRVGKSFFDQHVGWTAVFAILAALHYRQKTGKGQWLDLAMYQIGVATMGDAVLDYEVNGRNGRIMGNRHPYHAPHGVYPCRGDDKWIAIGVENDEQWQALAKAMGSPAWSLEERFADAPSRLNHQDELDSLLGQWTAGWDHSELMDALQEAGIPAAAVLNSREVLTNPHMRNRGFYERVNHHPDSGIGPKIYFGRPWKMSKTPSRIQRPAPGLGEHNEFILGDLLGHDAAEIERLYKINMLGKIPTDLPDFKPPSYQRQLEEGTLAGYDPDYSDIVGNDGNE